ncbi:MAG: response regulator [Lachnospiraceae bacterium]|nr:response regulator [Lachnospiraceae bacterium]
MLLKEQFNQFFATEFSIDVQMFRRAVSLGAAEFLIMMLVSILLREPVPVILLLLAGGCSSVLALFIHAKLDQLNSLTLGYLFLIHIILIPALGRFCENAIYDFPVYFVEGIMFTALLLKGRQAVCMILAEMSIDLFCIYRMTRQAAMVIAMQENGARYSPELYVRVIAAIGMTGSVCGLLIAHRKKLLREEIRKCTEMERQAEQVNFAKDMFLVNVSHEIRTPLNAILGTAELLVDLDADDKIKENAFDIANSSKALLAITNDLMDFSRIDYSNIRLEEEYYYVGELLSELLNVCSVRFADYNIELFVDISPDIPGKLWGDGAKFRQVLYSLLIGAVKSMESGEVRFNVACCPKDKQKVELQVELCARGVFQHSYLEKLRQEDDYNLAYGDQRGALVRQLIDVLGGKFEAEEKLNERSYCFKAAQGYQDAKAIVEKNRENVCILFYENSILQGNAFAKVLKDMGLRFCQASSNEYFYEECVKDYYSHIMIASERYESMKDGLKQILHPQSVILVSPGIVTYDDNLIRTTFARPVNCLNIDALLEGRKNNSIRYMGYRGSFICPEARIMVVDDNIINLEVASGILKKYEAQTVLVSSGKECLNYLQSESVDFIFLDYMMPEMDGIDTLKNIRALQKPELMHVPIVALTANAVSGARKMFMEAGFDEYISKPIELGKFEKVLREHLAENKMIFTTDNEAANER